MKDDESRLNTPSTSASNQSNGSEVKEVAEGGRLQDENQWIRYPALIQELTAEDPLTISEKISEKDVGVMNDILNMWTKTIIQLLDRLKDTIPGEGMLGEVHYWRDLSRVLDGIQGELKQPKVELTVQTMLVFAEKNELL